MASSAEFIGADIEVDVVCEFLDADSLHYISLVGLIDSTRDRRDNLCTACFTGD